VLLAMIHEMQTVCKGRSKTVALGGAKV